MVGGQLAVHPPRSLLATLPRLPSSCLSQFHPISFVLYFFIALVVVYCGVRNSPRGYENHQAEVHASEELPVLSDGLPFPFGSKPMELSDEMESSLLCGTWQSDYAKLHHEITEENKKTGKGKLLILSACKEGYYCGGLGDRLLGMSSILLLSIMFKRAMFVEWPTVEETEAFLPMAFDWRMKNISPNNQNVVKMDRFCGLPANSSDSFELDFMNFNPGKGEDLMVSCIAKLSNATTIRVHTNRGIAIWLAALTNSSETMKFLQQSGIKAPIATGCLLRNLVRPNEKALVGVKGLLQELQQSNKLKICIHSRYRRHPDNDFTGGDVDMDHYMAETNTLLQCANTLFEYWGQESVGTLWFFMSGSKEINQRVMKLYPDRVRQSGLPIVHSNLFGNASLALELAVAEWYLFTHCHFFVLHSSGMSKSAAAFSLRSFSLFAFGNYNTHKLKNTCNPVESTSLRDLALDWSGL